MRHRFAGLVMNQFYTVEKTIDDAIDALAEAIQPFCLECEIIRTQENRVPMPLGQFVAINEVLTVDLATPVKKNNTDGISAEITQSKRSELQIDFYGPFAGDQARAFSTVFRTGHMVSMLPDWIKPLYAADAVNAPLISGEQQYEQRWILTVSLQFNAVITVPVQTANTIGINIFKDIV